MGQLFLAPGQALKVVTSTVKRLANDLGYTALLATYPKLFYSVCT